MDRPVLKKTQWPESACELYRPGESRLSAKLVSTFADRGCHVVSVTNPYGRILGFIDWSRYFLFHVAPALQVWRVSNETVKYGLSSEGHGPQSDCSGKNQKQLYE
jgi:hypothetical protein